MEKRADNKSTKCFRILEEEERSKRLKRIMIDSRKGQSSSIGTKDCESGETSLLSISSINPESIDFLGTRQSLKTSKIASYVIASSNEPRRTRSHQLVRKCGGYRQPLATSSVKDHSEPARHPLSSGQNSTSDAPSYSTKQPSRTDGSGYELSRCGKPVASYSQRGVGARLARWTIMLNEQSKLVIKGNLICGSYCRSKPVLRKLSTKMVETINKSLYTLVGNIDDENHELPSYVRGKFHDGFPDDWENVHQVWLAFIRQGGPVNFYWPTDLADSDDDLRSEITDDTTECHLRNFPGRGQDLSHIEANSSALSRESLSLVQLPSNTLAPVGATGHQFRRNRKEARMNDCDKQQAAEVNQRTTDDVAPVSPATAAATAAATAVATAAAAFKVSIDYSARPESNQTLPICEEIDLLYKKFLNLFDRLRLTYSKSKKATSWHRQASSCGRMATEQNSGCNEPIGAGLAENSIAAAPPIAIEASSSAIEKNDYKFSERRTAISVNSDESESEVYAGVRKIPVGTILSHRRHFSEERKRMTVARRKCRDTYVRGTRRIRNIDSSPICSSEEENERMKGEEEGAFQKQYGEEEANAYRRALTRRPLSHIDSQLNVPAIKEQPNVPSRLLRRHIIRDIASSSSAFNGGVASKKEHAVENCQDVSSCQLTSTTNNKTIDREESIPDQVEGRRTGTRLEIASKSSDVIVEKWPAKRNQPVHRHGASTRKRNDSNATAERCIALEHNEEEEEEEEEEETRLSETAHHLPGEKVKEEVTTGQLLKSWLPRVVRKSDTDLDGSLIFHGHLINGAGQLVRRNVTTNSVRRRLSRSCIETVDSQVYELVGEMVDPRNTVPKRLLTQCRYGCPARIEDFCKTWIASLVTMKDTKLASPQRRQDASMETLNVPVSSKGRRILPPLSYWTGERVVLKDNNPVYTPGIVVDDIKEGEKNEDTDGERAVGERARSSGKRAISTSTSTDSNDESSPSSRPSNKRRRKVAGASPGLDASAEPISAEASNTRRSRRIHLLRTVKVDATLSGDEDDLDDTSSLTAARVQRLEKARGLRHGTTHPERLTAPENRHQIKKTSNVDRSDRKSPNLDSSMVKRRGEKVSYNFYKYCPAQEDTLSDDQLSHV